MATTRDLLHGILSLIRNSCHADAVSLYVVIPSVEGNYPLLIHEGRRPAVPELYSLETARSFIRSIRTGEKEPDEVGSSDEEGRLVPIPSLIRLLGDREEQEPVPERRDPDKSLCPGLLTDPGTPAWLGIRGGDRFHPGELIDSLAGSGPAALHLALGSLIGCRTQMICTSEMDPVSQLPSRSAYTLTYRKLTKVPGTAPGMILVNPDEFNRVNDRFDRETGDRVIREIGHRLQDSVRSTDFAFRYGAATFGVLIPVVNEERIRAIAAKLRTRLSGEGYRDGSVKLEFSLGAAVLGDLAPGDDGADHLARRADAALSAAKRPGSQGLLVWNDRIEAEEANRQDSLTGIYTADPSRDYRNMRLLWDTVRMIASSSDVERMKEGLLQELVAVFDIRAAGVYDDQASPPWRRLHLDGEDGGGRWLSTTTEMPELGEMRREVMEQGRTISLAAPESGIFRCMIPLAADGRTLGCMYLEGSSRLFRLNSGDLVFFEALAGQIALALDRNRLTALELQRHEEAREELRKELEELQSSIKSASLVYRSEAMERLLRKARRLAATDTTVLINGESGTGKEVLARAIHHLSRRSDRPMVVVDCSAIATSLIDSELFGHERGAFTGADRRADGRLLEADGGTLLLDEIGELPLEVQSKLLRFVQEKQFTPVGSSQVKTVDVRVIALTNRDLAAEAAAGRFREDLYHRLNVLRLVVPSLRDRPEDIEYLAIHFIRSFALRYERPVAGLTPGGREALLRHRWPGNVRELENRIMRAVVLADSDRLGPTDLELDEGPVADGPDPAPAPGPQPGQDGWEELRTRLAGEIERILSESGGHPPPIGKWLTDDLVLEAFRAAGEVTSRAASLLGVPETTFRRKLRSARGKAAAGLTVRTPGWDEVRRRITALLVSGNPAGEDLLDQARASILQELADRIPGNNRSGAAFMGVTETTYRKWIASTDLAAGS